MDKYTQQLRVRTDECGADCRLHPAAILRWIQDIAEDHASSQGFGYQFCCRHRLAWVEFRLAIRIHRLPEWKQTLDAATWTYPASPLIAYREFIISDTDGSPLIEATCQWVLIDARRRRPVALKKHISHFPEVPQGSSSPLVPIDEKRLSLKSHGTNKTTDGPPDSASDAAPCPVPSGNTAIPTRHFHAERSLVDFNRHINNSAYLIWALDTIPDSWIAGKRPAEIFIAFNKETLPGEDLRSLLQLDDSDPAPTSRHSILGSDGCARATLSIRWEPAPDAPDIPSPEA